MTTHEEARVILERAVPGISESDSLLTRVISCLEAHYGDWWKGAGVGSNNWGAVSAGSKWEGPTFEYTDSRWDPEEGRQVEYVQKFRKYATPEEGARDLYELLTSGTHKVASELAAAGRWGEISRAIGPRGTGYYRGVGPPEKAEPRHRAALMKWRDAIAGTGGVGWGLVVLVALLAAASSGRKKWR